MSDRRRLHISILKKGLFVDRRLRPEGRRRHIGVTRILFIDLESLWFRMLDRFVSY
jgi:hypothetical protein